MYSGSMSLNSPEFAKKNLASSKVRSRGSVFASDVVEARLALTVSKVSLGSAWPKESLYNF